MAKDRRRRVRDKPNAAGDALGFSRGPKLWDAQTHPEQDVSKLDHQYSKLSPAKFNLKLDQKEVIEKAKKGYLGCTEVPSKQIW